MGVTEGIAIKPLGFNLLNQLQRVLTLGWQGTFLSVGWALICNLGWDIPWGLIHKLPFLTWQAAAPSPSVWRQHKVLVSGGPSSPEGQ